jgi:hypothetical protein
MKKFRLIGKGRKRIVYDLRNGYVLKVARSKAGRRSNKTEYRLYYSSRIGSLRKHLAEVALYGKDWIMMKKYTRPFVLTSENYRKYLRLVRKFKERGILPRDMYSMTHRGPSRTNLRLSRSGRIIVIDYGNFRILPRRKWDKHHEEDLPKYDSSSSSSSSSNSGHYHEPVSRGRRIIGIGARRIVFDLRDGNVLKKAKSRYGIKSNRKEVKFYRTLPRSLRKYLGKIISHHPDYRWIIMKKYTTEVPRTYAYKKRIVKLKRKFISYGIIPYEVTRRNKKPNYPNIRLGSGGRVIVIDYGNFEWLKKAGKTMRREGRSGGRYSTWFSDRSSGRSSGSSSGRLIARYAVSSKPASPAIWV